MSFRPVPAIFHAAAMSVMTWAYTSLNVTPMHSIIMSRRGGHWGFLTIQGLGVAWITMALSFLGDIFPRSKRLNSIKRQFMMISMPLACTISAIYWGLVLFAPALILPRLPPSPGGAFAVVPGEPSAEAPVLARIPLSLDLALHALPGVCQALDFFFLEKKYTWNQVFTQAPVMALLFGIWYSGLTEYLAVLNKAVFPYPFLTLNPFPVRMGIYGGAVFLAFLFFNLLNTIHPGRPLTANIDVIQKEVHPSRTK